MLFRSGGHVFVFLNRRRNQVKLIVWTRGGFTIVHKRLERGTFTFPSRVVDNAPSIAIDVHEHRLVLARGLGATHTINHGGRDKVVDEVRAAAAGGVRYSLDTSALANVLREAIEALMPGGVCVLLGSAPPGTDVAIEMPFLQQGRTVRGVVQGESLPEKFIPQLVDLIVAGKFPIEKMIKFYDFADINLAAAESSSGVAIKPVLRMPVG